MSILAVTKLAWDLEHVEGLLDRFRVDSETVLDEYELTETERTAVVNKDTGTLLGLGVNPVALRNLTVLVGGASAAMYTQSHGGVGKSS